jgi:hypothetical protein
VIGALAGVGLRKDPRLKWRSGSERGD